jgi:hypothetical protein
VTKSTDDEKSSIVRVNIQTGQEFAVGIPSGGSLYPIAFLPSHNRVLIYRGPIKRVEFESVTYGERGAEETTPEAASAGNSKTAGAVAEYYLLDLHTGAIKAVKGDFRPIEDPHYRPLQASATPGATWAAVYDPAAKTTDVGLYVEKTFSFVPVATLPEIRLGSSDIWVHEKENKIYFVYQGHLLAAPLKQQ